MTTNLSVKALLEWVNNTRLSRLDVDINDLKDGTILQKLVFMMKKERTSCVNNSTEDPFRLVANFIERDCRFSAANGTCISWNNIRDGINLSVEISKVLLLLLYYDMMNDRCTLKTLDCNVEKELAHLTGSFLLENEDCVYLSNGLDAYLSKRYIPCSQDVFEQTEMSTSSSVSSSSSLWEDSPVLHRTQRVTFVEMETVASSSVSKSPLEDIMNTPKFQIRKMKRQIVMERDYRDGLERELASKVALISQRESHISQLQYRLDKMKEQQGDQEQIIRQQINDLEAKNDALQMRLNEILKENKDLKNTSSLMEHKVDELTDENGSLSFQMKAVCSQLVSFEAEVGRLTETQALAQEEWFNKTSHLQSELTQATAQKELLSEQIQILQGKISYLEDQMSKATHEDVGENMGPVIERASLESEISCLRNELENTRLCLKKAEVEIRDKSQQLLEFKKEIAEHKDLLNKEKSQTEEIIQAKDELYNKLQEELTEEQALLQQEIQRLTFELEQVEQQKSEEITRLQQNISDCNQEIQQLKDIKKEKEALLHQTEEKVRDLETKLAVANSVAADKDQQISHLKEEVDMLANESIKTKSEIQTKEEALTTLLLEKSLEQESLGNQIVTLTAELDNLSSSLKQAEHQIQLRQDQLEESQQEHGKQREVLQQQVLTFEKEVEKLRAEIKDRQNELETVKCESFQQSQLLQQEIEDLKLQLASLNDSLKRTKENVVAQEVMLEKQQLESAHQTEQLQQQLAASEELVKKMKEEIQTKEQKLTLMKNENSQQAKQRCEEIQDLKQHVDSLTTSLRTAEENLHLNRNLFADQQQESRKQIEELQKQVTSSREEVTRLNAEIHAKEDQLSQLKTDTSTHSQLLQQELEGLNEKIKTLSSSLETAKEQVETKENLLAEQEQQNSSKVEELHQHAALLEEEVTRLKREIQTKQGEVDTLQLENTKESDVLQKEIQTLKDQVEHLKVSLKTATEQILAKDHLLDQKETEMTQEKDSYENMMKSSEEEIRSLKGQIEDKEQELVALQKDSHVQEEEITTLRTRLERVSVRLEEAEHDVQSQVERLQTQQRDSAHHREHLQEQLSASEKEVKNMKAEVQAKEEQVLLLRTDTLEQCDSLNQEIQRLKNQVETLDRSLGEAQSDVQSKEVLLSQEQQINTQQKEMLQRLHEEVQQVNVLRREMSERDQELNILRGKVAAQEESLKQTKEEAEAKDRTLTAAKEESWKQIDALQNEAHNLKLKLENISETQLVEAQQSIQLKQQNIDRLQEQLVTVSAELKKHKDTQDENIRLQVSAVQEKETLVQEKEVLAVKIRHVEMKYVVLEKRLETVLSDHGRLAQAHQAMEREMTASQTSASELQKKLEKVQMEKDKLLKEKAEKNHHNNKELQEQLAAKAEAASHYKTQMENAMNHYNGKKQLLQKSQEEVDQLRASLEVKEMEKQLLTHELDEAQASNKTLVNKVASLEAQLAFADRALRAKNRINATGDVATDLYNPEVPIKNPSEKRSISSDSLDQSSLEFDLNTKTLSAPDESSTPLVRSSERLAAKRRAQRTESLETLYFTPINTRQTNRTSAEHTEMDSVRGNPTSSVKRRRTTINITLTKKTPGGSDDDSFHSLAPARSQPNLPSAYSSQFISKELFETPAAKTNAASDQLVGFPGYRRSAIHCQSASTFCAVGEGEDDCAPDDWLRIAELQARNKACLPHLKSSYPVECEPGRNSAFVFTDEELRTGDPSETIRRASMMPGQLQDSLLSHRQSMMLGHAGVSAGTRSHRLSLMPGQLPTKDRKFTSSTLFVPQTSPEKKTRASCFPRPLTPKNKNVVSGRSNSHLHTAVSPAEKKPATMFMIENTPKQKGYLQKRLDKICGSTRKSPSQRPKMSPALTSTHKSKENKAAGSLRAGVARTGREGLKSSQVATRKPRKSPQTSSRSAKSPGLTASARKMMRRMKV